MTMSPESIFVQQQYIAVKKAGYDWFAPLREVVVPDNGDFADARDMQACEIKDSLETLLERRRRISRSDLENLTFLLLNVAVLTLPDHVVEMKDYLDRTIVKLGAGAAPRMRPEQCIFVAMRASLFARRADRITQIKKAADATDNLNLKVRLLSLLAVAMETMEALRPGAAGVLQIAAAMRAQLTHAIWIFDDDSLWRALELRVRG